MYKPRNIENERIKDRYAQEKGLRLIRLDARKIRSPRDMKKFFQRQVGQGPHSPNTNRAKRRTFKRGSARRRPREK